MSLPHPRTFTVAAAQPALDERWFERIAAFNIELYIEIGLPHEELAGLRGRFESRPFNPDLRPRHLSTGQLQAAITNLTTLGDEIETNEPQAVVRDAYRQKIIELTAQYHLLLAAKAGRMDELAKHNRWLFGTPDAGIFAAVCTWLRQLAGDSYNSTDGRLSRVAAAMLEVLPDLNGSVHYIIPNSHVFKQVRDQHFAAGSYMEQLFGIVPLTETVTAANGDAIIRSAIAAVGSEYTLADSTDHLWGVIHAEHRVVRPAGYKLSRPAFMGIVSHEVGSHLLERENGRRQALRLLGVGLDRYEVSNEGRAFVREQIMYASPYGMLGQPAWEHIIILYLAASLSAGMYRQPYSFSELYTVLYAVCHFLELLHQPDNPVMAEAAARESAWHNCVRGAKGTAGLGGAFHKGLVYLAGNIQAWQLAAIDTGYIAYGDAGKFDISRADHRAILAACGITPPAMKMPL